MSVNNPGNLGCNYSDSYQELMESQGEATLHSSLRLCAQPLSICLHVTPCHPQFSRHCLPLVNVLGPTNLPDSLSDALLKPDGCFSSFPMCPRACTVWGHGCPPEAGGQSSLPPQLQDPILGLHLMTHSLHESGTPPQPASGYSARGAVVFAGRH